MPTAAANLVGFVYREQGRGDWAEPGLFVLDKSACLAFIRFSRRFSVGNDGGDLVFPERPKKNDARVGEE